jgi:hypothetical protein
MVIVLSALGIAVLLLLGNNISKLKTYECLGCGYKESLSRFFTRHIPFGSQTICPKCHSEKVYLVGEARKKKIDEIFEQEKDSGRVKRGSTVGRSINFDSRQ